jgi:Fe-S oxidoreductase
MALTPQELEHRKTQTVRDPFYLKYYYDPRKIAESCTRWGLCRFIGTPYVKSQRFSRICPSSAYYFFDGYSLQGRLQIALALMEGRLKYEDTPALLDIIYACNMCGGCDASCKLNNNEGEMLRVIEDLRAKLVEDGQLLPQQMPLIENLRKEDNMMMAKKTDRGLWLEGLKVKDLTRESAPVVYHAGCRLSFDNDQWDVPRTALGLLQQAGVDVGIFGKDETCCGGRCYEMGYRGETTKYAENNLEAWKRAGVKTVVVSCSDCYYTFRSLYPQLGSTLEVLHVSQYLERLVGDGKLKFTRKLPLKVTWHDPCHLGRRADAYRPGKPVEGVFDAPRNVLKAIPGVELVEMERTREYAWCCGAGCSTRNDYPEFNAWTAAERIIEAESTDASALITACGWCEKNFHEAVAARGSKLEVLDLAQLVKRAL